MSAVEIAAAIFISQAAQNAEAGLAEAAQDSAVAAHLAPAVAADWPVVAGNFTAAPNLIGWYVTDEPSAHGYTVAQQDALIAAARAAGDPGPDPLMTK